MERSWKIVLTGVLGVTFATVSGGCEGPPAEPVEIGSINRDLAVGATGPEVQALTNYLTTYGYFPNADLQSRFPAWRAIVATAPSSGDVFDGNERQAVFAFQRNGGLPQTGVFDAATRGLMATPRCEIPDGIQGLDPSDKWASENTTEGLTTTVNWFLQNNDGDLPTASVTSDIANMLNSWHQWSHYTFAQSSSNAEIIVSFGSLDSGTNASTASHSCLFLGHLCSDVTPGVPAPSYVTLNSARNWSDSGSPNSSQMDLPSILVHELGHALGLSHSSMTNAVMYPFFNNGNVKRGLSVDDIEGIAATNPVYVNVGAPAGLTVYRAAQNNHFNGPSIWALAGSTTGGNNQIWEQDGGWFQHPGGAVRLAVNPSSNNNQPWVTNSAGQIFRWNGSIQNWDNIPGCATDIGVGSDDSVWVIGCTLVGSSDYQIFKYNGDAACANNNCWTMSDGGATQISVGGKSPTDATIVPWVINSSSQIFRRTSSDPTVTGAWESLPGTMTAATGIAAGTAGYSYAIDNEGSGYPTVFSWDEQAAFSGGSPPAPAERGWAMLGLGTASPHPTTIGVGGLFPVMVAGGVVYTVN